MSNLKPNESLIFFTDKALFIIYVMHHGEEGGSEKVIFDDKGREDGLVRQISS